MKGLIYLSILSIIILFVSCSKSNERDIITDNDGIKIYKNSKPLDKNLKYDTNELFSIGGTEEDIADTNEVFNDITMIDSDSEGNLYVLDRRKSVIRKFDKQGDFISSMGKRGTGPGEMIRATDMVISEDTIYVSDRRSRKVLRFDAEGKFINDIMMPRETGTPRSFKKLNNEKFIGMLTSVARNSGARVMTMNLAIMDKKFNVLHSLHSKSFDFDWETYNPLDHNIEFAAGNDKIYVAETSESKYSIKVYDIDGKHVETIKKNYARIKYSETEKQIMKELVESRSRRRTLDTEKMNFKNSIIKIYNDKNGYLLVESSQKRDETNQNNFILDVFKDGKLLNTVDLNSSDKFYSSDEIYEKDFIDNRIVIYDISNMIIKVYSY
ncbi:MAG: 6-bladed beta-propeller [Candidatus Delongbacteria bacterium]|nr:6-bladed beta-propeller [Candidatus Delongbacteria bacterium]